MLHTRPLLMSLSLVALLACDPLGPSEGLSLGEASSLRLELRGDNGSGAAANGGANVAGELQEAVAVVHAVAAHVAGSGWHTIMEGHVEVDFLRLSQHAAELGVSNIPAGKLTQIRLYVLDDEAAYVRDADGNTAPLLTPSGSQSGIKVKGLWDIGECQAGVLTLATNGQKAIHIHGRGGPNADYVLRPVIRANGFSADDIEGCVPGDGGEGTPGDDGTPGAGTPGAGGEGTPGAGGTPGDGTPGEGEGEGDDCYSPETGFVESCEGGTAGDGESGGDLEGGEGADADGSEGGDGTVDGETGDSTDEGDLEGATGGTADGTDGDSTDADGVADGDGADGGGEEEDLCYSPESGFVPC